MATQFKVGDVVRLTSSMGPEFPAGIELTVASIDGTHLTLRHEDGRQITMTAPHWRLEFVRSGQPLYREFWRITLFAIVCTAAAVYQIVRWLVTP